MADRGIPWSGIKQVAGAGNGNIVDATTGRNYFVKWVTIAVSVQADTGTVLLDDATTTKLGPWLLKDDNNTHMHMNFGEHGIPWGSGKAIRVVVANGGTVNVTAGGYYRNSS